MIFTSYGDLVGCYISGKWLDRRYTSGSKYFGTGESFVFKLVPAPAQMYGWVGLESDKGSEKDSQDADSEAKRRLHRTCLYATGDDTMLAIGGGLVLTCFSNILVIPLRMFSRSTLYRHVVISFHK